MDVGWHQVNAKAVEGSALEAIQGTETFSAEPAGWDLDYGGDGSQRAMAFLIAQVRKGRETPLRFLPFSSDAKRVIPNRVHKDK